jgi:hypothetical protein
LNIGNNQLVSVWYYDKDLGQEVQLLYEQQPSLMFEMYAAELNVPLTVVVMDVTGSGASNCAENRVEFVPINIVPADDPLVIGTKNRECMRHLYQNFMKKFHGKVYTDHLYPPPCNLV